MAGHSYGGAIAIQLSLDAPDLAGSLALLKPALVSSVPSGPMFWETIAPIQSMYQPVLSVVGEESEPIFHEIHSVLQQWIPHAEELVVPQANHALEYMNPRAVADGLARFLDRHHL